MGSVEGIPLLGRVRPEPRADQSHGIGGLIKAAPSDRLTHVASDALERTKLDARPHIVEHETAHRAAWQ